MGREKVLLICLFLLISLSFFVSADQPINPNDTVIRAKMVFNLPELSGFTYNGTWAFPPEIPYYNIDLKYFGLNNSQRSEYFLEIFNSSKEANVSFSNRTNIARSSWNFSVKNINGNKILEGTSKLSIGKQRYALWISGNNVIQGWNGNGTGTIINDTLFDNLTNAYLEKYPSTYDNENLSSCVDSDAGLNYDLKGTTKGRIGRYGSVNYTDYCFNTSRNLGTSSNEAVMESYCNSNGKPSKVEYLCLNGCKEGACIEPVCTGGTRFETKKCNLTFSKEGSDTTIYTYYYKYCEGSNETCPSSSEGITSLGCTNPSGIRPLAILCFGYNHGSETCYDSDFCPLVHKGPMGSDKNPKWETGSLLLTKMINFFKNLFGIK